MKAFGLTLLSLGAVASASLAGPARAQARVSLGGVRARSALRASGAAKPGERDAAHSGPKWMAKLHELQEQGAGGAVLLVATAISLTLANYGPTAAGWLQFWALPRGVSVAGHALSLRGWCNEGLMAIFFFVVGLEIKQELRNGSLRTPKTAVLPCIAACGGMVTPMAVYAAINLSGRVAGGSLSALAVPMATDIAFAMAVISFFKNRMPAAASVFLLTLATVDDIGAIAVLATCYATHLAPAYLGLAAAITAALTVLGRRQATAGADAKLFAVGGVALWWSLLRAGISADIAGVVAGLCVSTRAMVGSEPLTERLIMRLAPLSAFLIMPAFALANTAVPIGAALGAGAQTSLGPALGISAGLLVGKPVGIFAFTWLATKLGVAELPSGMSKRHLAVVGMLGAIGFTMCLLLTEVAMPASAVALPKLAVLVASGVASVLAAVMMRLLPERNASVAAAA
jgi:NhaA family Na+:H+ antiporter